MQLFPGIFMVTGTAYGTGQNLYLLDNGQGSYVMIDAGGDTAESIATVQRSCSIWGIDMHAISHLLLTHAHYDHTSFANQIQALGAQVLAHNAAREPLETGNDRVAAFFFHQPFKTVSINRTLADGDVLTIGRLSITCIGAPGHSECSIVYDVQCDDRHLLFVGDVIALNPDRSVTLGWNGDPTYNPSQYIDTLRKMRSFRCDALMPGHGVPVLINGGNAVEDAYCLAMTTLR